MRLALMGQKLGHQVFIVIEQLSEIDVLLQVADEMGVTPTAGVRIKLASRGFGRWKESGGEKSKFGLNAAQLMQAIDKLKAAGRLDIIKLIHFHLGSQITDIRFIKIGLQELTRFYVELRNAGPRHHARGRRRRTRRRLRRHELDVRRERELLAAGVRERRDLHDRRGVPRARAPDAAHHQRVGARAHGAPRAAADQGDRRRVAGRPAGAGADRRRPSAAARDDGRLSRRVAQERVAAARARDLPRRHVRQGARAGAVQQRRALAARARAWPSRSTSPR